MIDHCIATIERIVAEDRGDLRAVFQLGYNLGRLSELTGLGREPFWDRWKDAVLTWDRDRIAVLASDLRSRYLADGAATSNEPVAQATPKNP
jgi:hypothetical protein